MDDPTLLAARAIADAKARAKHLADERLVAKAVAAAVIGHVLTQLRDQASIDRLLDVIAKAGAQALREQSAGLQQ